MTVNEKIDYLFSKINWGASNLDAKAIQIMNSLKTDIEQEPVEMKIIQENGFIKRIECERPVLATVYDDYTDNVEEDDIVEAYGGMYTTYEVKNNEAAKPKPVDVAILLQGSLFAGYMSSKPIKLIILDDDLQGINENAETHIVQGEEYHTQFPGIIKNEELFEGAMEIYNS